MARFNKHVNRRRNFIPIVIYLLGLGCAGNGMAGNVTEFRATIGFEGTCSVDVPATVTFNNFTAVLPTQIEAKDQEAAVKTSRITLSGCSGVGLTPKVTVSGNVNTRYGKNLFRDTASTSVGYGILLATTGSQYFRANDNLATNKTIQAIAGWDKSTQLSAINDNIPLIATLTCGTCATDGRIGGDLKATVTFNFVYE